MEGKKEHKTKAREEVKMQALFQNLPLLVCVGTEQLILEKGSRKIKGCVNGALVQKGTSGLFFLPVQR